MLILSIVNKSKNFLLYFFISYLVIMDNKNRNEKHMLICINKSKKRIKIQHKTFYQINCKNILLKIIKYLIIILYKKRKIVRKVHKDITVIKIINKKSITN